MNVSSELVTSQHMSKWNMERWQQMQINNMYSVDSQCNYGIINKAMSTVAIIGSNYSMVWCSMEVACNEWYYVVLCPFNSPESLYNSYSLHGVLKLF